jgi:ABC-type Fe3+-hydroxamate transport system substrate-binding protein
MRYWNKFVRTGLLIVAVTAALTACSSVGDLTISNESSSDVTVSTVLTGGDEIVVSAGGGASILGSGCTPGDVTVEFPSGEKFVVAGPVCPEEQIVVRNGKVELQPSS